ncbi:MAG TPA: MlaD family protein [Opitutaceae bacterium]|nr:MlaD family protein [Opitutaceae bacterium]
MNAPATPKVTRGFRLPLVWIVPLIAVAVGGWMIFREFHDRGPEITIHFADGSGVEADKTVLEHKGVSVGIVTAVELNPDLNGVTVRLRLNKSAASLAAGGAQFWIVHPEIGLSGVHGLDTLLTGARLNVRPGKGPPATEFTGLERTPPPEVPKKGRTFILQSEKLASLTTGAPVFYREMKVGEVETSRLADDATLVLVRIHIESAYVDLVRTNTRFWNAGGFSFKIGLLGAELKNTSLESLVAGGVAFATPDTNPLAAPAEDGAVFTLTTEADKDWLKWSPKIPIKSPETVSRPEKVTDKL